MKSIVLIYLLSLGAFSSFLFQNKTKKESIKAGSEIYQDFCSMGVGTNLLGYGNSRVNEAVKKITIKG